MHLQLQPYVPYTSVNKTEAIPCVCYAYLYDTIHIEYRELDTYNSAAFLMRQQSSWLVIPLLRK